VTTDQPFAAWDLVRAGAIVDGLKDLPGACLPIFHAIQDAFGYIHDEAIPLVAGALNLSRAEVVGVVEFYADFRRTPPAAHQVRVCLSESCQAMGGAAVVEAVSSALGADMGGRSADGSVELTPVYCLGNCALSPALTIDGRLHGRLTPERAQALAGGLR